MAMKTPAPDQTMAVKADNGGRPKAAPGSASKPVKPVKTQVAARPAVGADSASQDNRKREKLVRDSFTIPKSEYETLVGLKHRAVGLAVPVKKSELLRAGVMALAAMSDGAFLGALKRVPALKTGRPAE